MKVKIFKRIYAFLAAALVLVSFLFGQATYSTKAKAEENASLRAYDNTSIVEDLKDIDILLYPKNPLGHHQVLRFQEYCYSEYPLYSDYYGLYVYVYNPTEKPIYEYGNVLNMATEYESGKPMKYENVSLTLLDTMDTELDGKYENRFFKFKIADSARFLSLAKEYAAENEGTRRYDVAGVQLCHTDGDEEMDSALAKTYYYRGFAKGLGESSKESSTLSVTSDKLDTLELEVGHTYYRTGQYYCQAHKKGACWACGDRTCDEINTVYFSVPQDYFEKYGKALQKIKAEWYEYKTNPIFVTSDGKAYDALKEYIGKDIGGNRLDDLRYRILWEASLSEFAENNSQRTYHQGYNPYIDGLQSFGTCFWMNVDYITQLDWLFERDETKSMEDWRVTSKEVVRYMEWYTAANSEQELVAGKYAEGLFAESIDADRLGLLEDENAKRGYIVEEIDAGDTGNMLFEKDQSWWDEFWWGTKFEDKSVSPIVQVDDSIKGLSATQFAEDYYVNEHDAQKVYDYCLTELKAGNQPILFRFAQTDYYATEAAFDLDGDLAGPKINGYVAQETTFLGFELISLTFKAENEVETVIPVVSSPLDIINGIDAPSNIPTDEESFWDAIIGILELIVGLIVVAIIIWIVSLIVKLFKFIFGSIATIFKK